MSGSIADQGACSLGGQASILYRQKRDHVRLDRLLQELSATPDPAVQDRVLRRIARLVFPHAFAEESVLWPQLRRVLPNGDELSLRVEREHQEVNELWSLLEQLPHQHPERPHVLARIVEVLREDVRDEEDVLLPRLQTAVPVRRLRALGLYWELVRRIAPTRPHAVVSRRPPGNALAALPLTILDRSRDLLDAVANRRPTWSGPLAHASRSLATAAGRIERAGLLRRGEDDRTRR
jgi:hemerythrin superfamily protein